MKVSIIIPVYNEHKIIKSILEKVQAVDLGIPEKKGLVGLDIPAFHHHFYKFSAQLVIWVWQVRSAAHTVLFNFYSSNRRSS